MEYVETLRQFYAVVLCGALWLNRHEARMAVLTLVAAAGIYFPIPWFDRPSYFYLACLSVEICVAYCAYFLAARASIVIVGLSMALGLMHLTGAIIGPQSGISPYRITVPILEFCELLACCLLSAPVSKTLMRRG